MRPPNRNDGSTPSQRKRVPSITTASFTRPETALATSTVAASSLAADLPPSFYRTHNPAAAKGRTAIFSADKDNFMFHNGGSQESIAKGDYSANQLLSTSYVSDRDSSSSTSAQSSDSGSTSDCGKDLVKRKRFTTVKSIKCEEDVLSGDGLSCRRTLPNDPSSSSSLTLVKNSASLIFTKKIIGSQPVVHRKRESRGDRRENRCSLQGISEHEGAVGVETVLKKERTHSWYAPLYTPLNEDVDQDSATVS